MKTKFSYFILALLFALPFAVSSCSSNDDDDLSSDLVGTWKETDALSTALSYTVYVQFKKDGTYIEVDCFNGDADVSEGTWVRNGSTVTISGGDFVKTETTIKKLTSTSLVMSTLGIETTYVKVSDAEIEQYLD